MTIKAVKGKIAHRGGVRERFRFTWHYLTYLNVPRLFPDHCFFVAPPFRRHEAINDFEINLPRGCVAESTTGCSTVASNGTGNYFGGTGNFVTGTENLACEI
jgi:hypothetical protein